MQRTEVTGSVGGFLALGAQSQRLLCVAEESGGLGDGATSALLLTTWALIFADSAAKEPSGRGELFGRHGGIFGRDGEGRGRSVDAAGMRNGIRLVLGWARGATEHSVQQPTLVRASVLIPCQLEGGKGSDGR